MNDTMRTEIALQGFKGKQLIDDQDGMSAGIDGRNRYGGAGLGGVLGLVLVVLVLLWLFGGMGSMRT
jgi:hypothetical protein